MQPIPPPWDKNWNPSAVAPPPGLSNDDGRFKPGQSGNPAGRPPGAKSKRTLLGEALEARCEEVGKAMIDKALEGDTQAARLVLERVAPPKRPEGNRVNFKFDADGDMADQARQVLAAMACGDIEVEIGQIFLNSLSTYAGLIEHTDLSKRIAELEATARAGAASQGALGNVMQTGVSR